MKKFLATHHRMFMTLGYIFALMTAAMYLTACAAPTWLTDAGSIITLVGLSFASIASFIAGLSGNPALSAALAEVSAWIGKVQTGISDIEALVDQYNQSPNPTLLSDIENACADVQTNIKQDFSNLGLPATVLNIISGIAGLALSQLVAWSSLFPAVSAKAMERVTITVPMTKNEFKAAVDAILNTPTGDPEIDAALAKVKRL
jgi:hypothetical protein